MLEDVSRCMTGSGGEVNDVDKVTHGCLCRGEFVVAHGAALLLSSVAAGCYWKEMWRL